MNFIDKLIEFNTMVDGKIVVSNVHIFFFALRCHYRSVSQSMNVNSTPNNIGGHIQFLVLLFFSHWSFFSSSLAGSGTEWMCSMPFVGLNDKGTRNFSIFLFEMMFGISFWFYASSTGWCSDSERNSPFFANAGRRNFIDERRVYRFCAF